jgi:hypothetical protein
MEQTKFPVKISIGPDYHNLVNVDSNKI